MRRLLLLVLLCLSLASVHAAAPNRLGYQGRLANASGLPITANLNITFRLYDSASGGAALWTETQSAVPVDGGNLAVELGSVTPLPGAIWGRQLYLGIQVAGDSEMTPRPPLTAAPYALRAAGTLARTVEVSAEGTAAENGAALLAALPRLASAAATSPMTLVLDAGSYDIGNQRIDIPPFVTIAGAGQEATLITSSFSNGTLLLASNSHARRLTARNTGIPLTDSTATFGIGAGNPDTIGLVQNISMEAVTGEAIGVPGALGARQGIFLCAENSRIVNVIGRGVGGNFSFGMRADCGNSLNASGLLVDGLTLFSSGAASGLRGVYVAGGGSWNNVEVFVEANNTAQTTLGVRGFKSTVADRIVFTNLAIRISGNGASTAADTSIEALRLEDVDMQFKGVRIGIEDVRATFVVGVRVNSILTTADNLVSLRDVTIGINAQHEYSLEFGGVFGVRAINAAPKLSDATIEVACAVSANLCHGVSRDVNGTLQDGALVLDRVSIEVGHVNPLSAAASAAGYRGVGAALIRNSSIRILRSAVQEFAGAVGTSQVSSDISVLNSSIEVINATAPAPTDCTLTGGSGQIEVFSSHLVGTSCVGGTTLTCAGNTRGGVGFLASTCQ